MTYSERMTAIMEVIRKRGDWKVSYNECRFGSTSVSYYDTASKDSCFSLTYDGVKITHISNDELSMEMTWTQYGLFSLAAWLTVLEKVVQQNIITINGKNYNLVPISEAK